MANILLRLCQILVVIVGVWACSHIHTNSREQTRKKTEERISGWKKCLISLPVYRDMFSYNVTEEKSNEERRTAHPSVPCSVIRIYETPISFQKGLYMSELKYESNHYKRKYANPCDWRGTRVCLSIVGFCFFCLCFFFVWFRAQMRNDKGFEETEISNERKGKKEPTTHNRLFHSRSLYKQPDFSSWSCRCIALPMIVHGTRARAKGEQENSASFTQRAQYNAQRTAYKMASNAEREWESLFSV